MLTMAMRIPVAVVVLSVDLDHAVNELLWLRPQHLGRLCDLQRGAAWGWGWGWGWGLGLGMGLGMGLG